MTRTAQEADETALSLADLHELIAYGRLEVLECAAGIAVADEDVIERAAPELALTMVRATDTIQQTVFNLGEALVTRCEVEVGPVVGWSTVVGDQRHRALCGALLDAAYRGPLGIASVEALLAEELQACREARSERWAELQATRVEFEEMAP